MRPTMENPDALWTSMHRGWTEGWVGKKPGRRILDYTIGSSANVLEGIMHGLFAQKQITINKQK